MSVRVLKWEASRPDAVVCESGRSAKSLISALRSYKGLVGELWSRAIILTSSSTAFCNFSRSSTSRFLFRERSSLLGRPRGLGFRPSVGGAIIHGGCGEKVCSFEAEDLFLMSDGASGRAGGADEVSPLSISHLLLNLQIKLDNCLLLLTYPLILLPLAKPNN
jgi:hypothetical protein